MGGLGGQLPPPQFDMIRKFYSKVGNFDVGPRIRKILVLVFPISKFGHYLFWYMIENERRDLSSFH